MSQNMLFDDQDNVKYPQHLLILFFCALSVIKELDLLMVRCLATVLLYFFVICNTFCTFDLGNITLLLLAI